VSVKKFTAAYANPCGISNHCLLLQGLFARSGEQTRVPFMFKKCLCFPVWRIRIRTDPYSDLDPHQSPNYGAVETQNGAMEGRGRSQMEACRIEMRLW